MSDDLRADVVRIIPERLSDMGRRIWRFPSINNIYLRKNVCRSLNSLNLDGIL